MKKLIYSLIFSSLICIFFSAIAFAEDVYVGNHGINATGTKRIDCYLITESISITNDVCYADVKEVLNNERMVGLLHYAFCWSPGESIWKFHKNYDNERPPRNWYPLENDNVASTVFYDYVKPKRASQMSR